MAPQSAAQYTGNNYRNYKNAAPHNHPTTSYTALEVGAAAACPPCVHWVVESRLPGSQIPVHFGAVEHKKLDEGLGLG